MHQAAPSSPCHDQPHDCRMLRHCLVGVHRSCRPLDARIPHVTATIERQTHLLLDRRHCRRLVVARGGLGRRWLQLARARCQATGGWLQTRGLCGWRRRGGDGLLVRPSHPQRRPSRRSAPLLDAPLTLGLASTIRRLPALPHELTSTPPPEARLGLLLDARSRRLHRRALLRGPEVARLALRRTARRRRVGNAPLATPSR